MKKDKKEYNCISGIFFIVVNIIFKFILYGYEEIWCNYMPPLPERIKSPAMDLFKLSINKMIPFIIIDICAVLIYAVIMYHKKIYNKKTDIIIPIVVLALNLILLYFLIRGQYRICV